LAPVVTEKRKRCSGVSSSVVEANTVLAKVPAYPTHRHRQANFRGCTAG
jgi:hypothetical protein